MWNHDRSHKHTKAAHLQYDQQDLLLTAGENCATEGTTSRNMKKQSFTEEKFLKCR